MPMIAIFYGITIQMYWRDHAPPHIHAMYQGFEAHRDRDGEADWREISSERAKDDSAMGLASKKAASGKLEAGAHARAVPGDPRAGRTGMIEIIKILTIEKLRSFRLRLHFSDGTEGEWYFEGLIAEGGSMVEPLKSPKYFKRVFLQLGALTWPNGFDLDSIALHNEMMRAGALRRTAA
jgi:hypothetical protein